MEWKESQNLNFGDRSYEAKIATHICLWNAQKKCNIDSDIK